MERYKPKYKTLSKEQGEAFIEKNKDKLECNCFMDYEDYYNKDMMRCRDAYDKNWGKRIVLRWNMYSQSYQLNTLYEKWL